MIPYHIYSLKMSSKNFAAVRQIIELWMDVVVLTAKGRGKFKEMGGVYRNTTPWICRQHTGGRK